jgi:hypothetical protein
MSTFFSTNLNPSRTDIDNFLNERANIQVVENTMKELNTKISKPNAYDTLHPSEKYFMEQYEARKSGTKGGRRLSKKHPTARRRRSSKARKSRKSRKARNTRRR